MGLLLLYRVFSYTWYCVQYSAECSIERVLPVSGEMFSLAQNVQLRMVACSVYGKMFSMEKMFNSGQNVRFRAILCSVQLKMFNLAWLRVQYKAECSVWHARTCLRFAKPYFVLYCETCTAQRAHTSRHCGSYLYSSAARIEGVHLQPHFPLPSTGTDIYNAYNGDN